MLTKLTTLAALTALGALVLVAAAPGSERGRQQQQGCFGASPTITGSGVLNGTDGDDVIVGSDGNDEIHGRAGNDKICAGAGDDRAGGGPGDDQVAGGAGNDELDGGLGDDTVLGGEGDDQIACGTGTDVADGGPGSNTAVTTGFEACETVTAASGSATAPTPRQLTAELTNRHPVPRPTGGRGAAGRFTATLTKTGTGATVVWRLTFSRLSGRALAASIHRGRSGRAGPVLASLCRPCRSGARGTAILQGQPARRAVLSGEAYVSVRTARNPRGEIRGQIRNLSR